MPLPPPTTTVTGSACALVMLDELGVTATVGVISAGEVRDVGPDLAVPRGATVLEAGDCLVSPGLVDLHTHLRQPGAEDAERMNLRRDRPAVTGAG